MARRIRLDLTGFHHVVNRGVAKRKIYLNDEDKDKFLEILCKACKIYKVNVHDYCLMDNHYHVFIETTSENLSLFMRQINGNYAIYFNKKYKRVGHLWQGRYKSWYVVNEAYFYSIFRYIEHNPIKARMAKTVGEYPYTLLATLLNPQLELIACAEHSRLKKELHYEGVQELLEKRLSKKELGELESEEKKKIVQTEHEWRQEKEKTLEEHFENSKDLIKRNSAILRALDDGYTQGEVARYLSLSSAMVSKIFRGVR
jgi:REP element-mobilizing transposase RayT